MNKIIIIALVTLIASKINAQSYPQYPQKVTWDPLNSYITAGVVTTLGTIVYTKYPVEITPQIGPSINWFRNDPKEYDDFAKRIYTPEFETQLGHIWGYSVGATISTVKSGINLKSGLFLENKGRSYSAKGWIYNQYPYGTKTWVESEGYMKINYITIPLMVGMQTDSQKTALTLDLGGFLSLPISEYHTSTTNGVKTDIEPGETVGVDAGLLADIGIKMPLSERISLRADLRQAIGLNNTIKLAYGAYTQSTQLLFGISIRPKSK